MWSRTQGGGAAGPGGGAEEMRPREAGRGVQREGEMGSRESGRRVQREGDGDRGDGARIEQVRGLGLDAGCEASGRLGRSGRPRPKKACGCGLSLSLLSLNIFFIRKQEKNKKESGGVRERSWTRG